MTDFDAISKACHRQFLVYTDLDGTLLDHDDYRWQPAASAIDRLNQCDCPLMLNSSKTVEEMRELRVALGNRHPFIAENGSVIAIPRGYPEAAPSTKLDFTYLGPTRETIREALQQFRQQTGAEFRAFFDMDVAEICRHTNLTPRDAEQAAQRQATEPLLWHDSETVFNQFEDFLRPFKLRLLRGGRFIHVMGQCDKASAMLYVNRCFEERWSYSPVRTIALGDSPNDRDMLNTADIAVIMAAEGQASFDANGHQQTIFAGGTGPSFWNRTIHTLLDSIAKGENHG